MMYKMFCLKNLCVLPSGLSLRVEDGVLRGEGPISDAISSGRHQSARLSRGVSGFTVTPYGDLAGAGLVTGCYY